MRRSLLLAIVAGFLGGAFIAFGMLVHSTGSNKARVVTSGDALVGGPFTLVGHDGKAVADEDFRGRYMLVFFGFTHCPDICPAELQVMSAALDELGDDAEKIVPIFITLDPERDTPDVVAAYLENFGSNFIGLTGSPEAIAKAAKAYRVAYKKFQDESMGDNYSIDHSALVYFMGPDGKFLDHVPYGTPPAQMARTLRRYL